MADEPAPPPAGPGRGGGAPREPAGPPPGVDRDGPPSGEQDPSAGAQAYGILAVSRHVKDDGRSLLLYTRRSPEGS